MACLMAGRVQVDIEEDETPLPAAELGAAADEAGGSDPNAAEAAEGVADAVEGDDQG